VERFRRPEFLVLWLSIAAGAAYRLWVAFTDDGIFWPDEIYQSLEPAHRLVFGYGLIPWEFIEGARNWALPGFVAFLLKLSVAFGGSEPRAYLGVVRVAFIALSMGTVWAAYQLARAYGARELAAAAGASTFALGALPLYFGHRAMSETASLLPVTLGLWLVLRPDAVRKHLVWGASLLGLAVLVRLQCGLFAAGALAVLAARRQRTPTLVVFATLCGWALLYGLLDKLTWGGWFHSAQEYIRFNFIEGKAAGWGTMPWHHLLTHLFSSMTVLAVVFALGLLLALKHARGLSLIAIVFFAAHCMTAHKEIRFILPVLPLFAACVGVAVSQVMRSAPLVVLCGLVSMGLARSLTMGDLGAYPERAQDSAWDDKGPVNRLLLAAHSHADLCGIRIDTEHLAWTGGSTYLHREAPLYMGGQPPPQARLFNYVITLPGRGGEEVARERDHDHELVLVHIPVEPCNANPGYTWRLP
jgi:GPI mannosyltransferase 3